MVALEAMAVGTPIVVNGDSDVLRAHCEKSGAGLSYRTFFEFGDALDRILDCPGEAEEMGRKGKAYVAANYTWERLVPSLAAMIESAASASYAARRPRQFAPPPSML